MISALLLATASAPPYPANLDRALRELRTSPVVVDLSDGSGKSVSGARVTFRLIKGEFLVGISLTPAEVDVLSQPEPRPLMTLAETYNLIAYRETPDLAGVDRQSPRLRGLGFSLKGQSLLPKEIAGLPSLMRGLKGAELQNKVVDRVAADLSYLRTSLDQTDVMVLPGGVATALGDSGWQTLLSASDRANPTTKLGLRHDTYLNRRDATLLPNGWTYPRQLRVVTLPYSFATSELKSREIWDKLNLLQILGSEVHIVVGDLDKAPIGVVRETLATFAAHPSVAALVTSDTGASRDEGIWPLFASRTLRTSAVLDGGLGGRVTLTAFRGDYEITVRQGNRFATRRVTVGKGPFRMRINL